VSCAQPSFHKSVCVSVLNELAEFRDHRRMNVGDRPWLREEMGNLKANITATEPEKRTRHVRRVPRNLNLFAFSPESCSFSPRFLEALRIPGQGERGIPGSGVIAKSIQVVGLALM
jgi:hypothetical protein